MNPETVKPKNSGLAIASLTLGILSVPFGFFAIGALLGILAIVFGCLSLKDNKGKAIAGIITGAFGIITTIFMTLLIVIILPHAMTGLQTSQRDTQRKNDLSVLASDVMTYESNNEGQLPDNEWMSGMTYKLDAVTSTTSDGSATNDTVKYTPGQDCDGTESAHNFSLTILLESGVSYCQGS